MALRQRFGEFDAIAHPVRRTILECLLHHQDRPQTITAVADEIGVSRSTASRHFVILRESGLVISMDAKPAKLHAIRLNGFAAVDGWLWRFLREWG